MFLFSMLWCIAEDVDIDILRNMHMLKNAVVLVCLKMVLWKPVIKHGIRKRQNGLWPIFSKATLCHRNREMDSHLVDYSQLKHVITNIKYLMGLHDGLCDIYIF